MDRNPSAFVRMASAALVAVALGPAPLLADDGSWSTSFRESGGPIYSQTPNADIALDAEILRFTMRPEGITQAVFLFRNTSPKAVDVEAGFPITVSFGVGSGVANSDGDERKVFTLAKYYYQPEVYGLDESRAFFGDAITFDPKFGSDEDGPDGPRDGAWLIEADAATTRKTMRRGDFHDPFSFAIFQDGRWLQWDYAVLDPSVEATKYGDRMTLAFHFHHVLRFKPKSASVVAIVYSQNTLRGGEPTAAPPMEYHGWDYVLGTGGTWKGPIGKLLLCLPQDADPALPAAFRPLGIHGKERIFLARNYRPAEDDQVSLKRSRSLRRSDPDYFERLWFDVQEAAVRPAAPAQEFVKVRGASSFLGDRTAVYTPEGVIKDMDFSPLRLVDGVLESSWVEGVKGDGIGEWVELELSRDVAGVEIQNGFSMSRTAIKGKNIDTYYEKNNRVRELLYASKDGATRGKIELEDTNDHLQPFPLALPKGVYRFTIGSIYKGSTWDDTCLGEIVFLPASEALAEVLAGDEFLRKTFPMDDPQIDKP